MHKISRRTFNIAALSTLILGPSACATTSDGALARTPAQGSGPYYPVDMPADPGNDLVRGRGGPGMARGNLLRLGGRVLDPQGQPRSGLTVVIWQVDHQAIYNHPRAERREQRDPDFQGYGASVTDRQGRYEFLTLVPVEYHPRPPHIHVRIFESDREILTTQLYLKDHPLNIKDGMFMWLFGLGSTAYLQIEPRDAGVEAGRPLQQAEFDFVV